MKYAAAAIATLFVLALALLAFAYSGAYDIAADDPHWPATEALLRVVRDRSLDAAAASVRVPSLDDPKAVAKGARDYAEMCAGCHLSPISRDSETRQGLHPRPPDFYRRRVAPARAFQAIKHGIKMSGMPAWGSTHDDATIWNIVALLQKLPEMDPETYKRLAQSAAPVAANEPATSSHAGHQHSH